MKFKLRKLVLKDADSLAINTNDKSIAENLMYVDFPYTKKHAIEWIKEVRSDYVKKKPEDLYFGIDVDGLVVGEVALNDIDHEHRRAEISFWLGKGYRGKGIMKKAVKEMIDYGFKKLKLVRISATVFVKNKASIELMKSLGFKYEGEHKKVTLKNGKHLDEYTYALINTKYKKK